MSLSRLPLDIVYNLLHSAATNSVSDLCSLAAVSKPFHSALKNYGHTLFRHALYQSAGPYATHAIKLALGERLKKEDVNPTTAEGYTINSEDIKKLTPSTCIRALKLHNRLVLFAKATQLCYELQWEDADWVPRVGEQQAPDDENFKYWLLASYIFADSGIYLTVDDQNVSRAKSFFHRLNDRMFVVFGTRSSQSDNGPHTFLKTLCENHRLPGPTYRYNRTLRIWEMGGRDGWKLLGLLIHA